jgi:DNA repair protein RadD
MIGSPKADKCVGSAPQRVINAPAPGSSHSRWAKLSRATSSAERASTSGSSSTGSIEQDVDLDGRDAEPGEAPTKTCPGCEAEVPLGVRDCPLCGHIFESAPGGAPLDHFVMTEIDLLSRSSFRWVDLFGDDGALIANGFTAWGGAFFLNGRWHAVGGAKDNSPRLLAIGESTVCLAAADDWLNEHETDESAHKSRRWLDQPPTEKQLAYLPPEQRQDLSLTRYEASVLLTFRFNRGQIRRLIFEAVDAVTGMAA